MNINYAIVSAFERSKDEGKQQRSTSRLFTVVLMAVFFIVLMIGLVSGVMMYRHVVSIQEETNVSHLQTGLVANIVHVNDTVYSVNEGEGPEGRALVLIEEINGSSYETRIYRYSGYIVQEYAIAGRDYAPTRATQLFESDTFDFSFDGKMLTITTDQGSVNVALRSRQGGGL